MGIGAISDYSSFFQNYKIPEIPRVDLDAVSQGTLAVKAPSSQELATQTDTSQAENAQVGSVQERLEVKNARVEDVALSFSPSDDFSYLGKDADIELLDMEKAISDMKKDEVLQQYQFFVGDSFAGGTLYDGNDGKVILK